MQSTVGWGGLSQTAAAPVRGDAPRRFAQGGQELDRDAQFVEMLNGYRHSGGLARAGDVATSLGQRGASDIATIARWIVHREVIHFEWQAETWLPLFQIGAFDRLPHAAVGLVIVELAGAMPPWELAQWFAWPHCALAGRRPADALASDAAAVVRAARASRHLIDA